MTVTITTSNTYQTQLKMICKDARFAEKYGAHTVWTSRAMLFANMRRIADWCNNVLGEECAFDVE